MRHRYRLTVFAAALAVASNVANAGSATDEAGYYTVNQDVSGAYLALRNGPAPEARLLVKVPAGTEKLIISSCLPRPEGVDYKYPFCKVRWGAYYGWISSCCITKTASAKSSGGQTAKSTRQKNLKTTSKNRTLSEDECKSISYKICKNYYLDQKRKLDTLNDYGYSTYGKLFCQQHIFSMTYYFCAPEMPAECQTMFYRLSEERGEKARQWSLSATHQGLAAESDCPD